jgi:hypothetical protein
MELRGDGELREGIRRRAHEDVVVRHSPDRIYGTLMRIYERAVGGEKPDGREIERMLSYDLP